MVAMSPSISKSRFFGGLLSSKNKEDSLLYEEVLEDDDSYEEIIIEEGEDDEYFEEIIEELSNSFGGSIPTNRLEDLRATQEQVDSMSFHNAKKYLMALPNAKEQTSAPSTFVDEEYEYEEIELPEVVTPINRSRRLSLFDAPALEFIEEGSEHSERSSSVKNSPSMKRKDRSILAVLSSVDEGTCAAPESASSLMDNTPSRQAQSASQQSEGESSQEIIANNTGAHEKDTILTATQGLPPLSPYRDMTIPMEVIGRPLSVTKLNASTSSINKSSKSIKSDGTAATMALSDIGSNSSLDIRQVFGLSTPSASPDLSSAASPRKRASSTSGQNLRSSNESSSSPVASSGQQQESKSDGALGQQLKSLGDSNKSPHRRRRDDDDNRSTFSSKSAGRSRRHSSSRTSGSQSVCGTKPSSSSSRRPRHSLSDPANVEREIQALLASANPSGGSGVGRISDLASLLSSPVQKKKTSSSSHSGGKSVSRNQSRSASSSAKSTSRSPSKSKTSTPSKPKGSLTLDDLLSNMPSEPRKRSDARSTVSALVRSSRGRKREEGHRDSQSVVGGEGSNRGRARSARRPKKKGDSDDASVASMSDVGKRPRARSSSVGRKERLRRNRRKEDLNKFNQNHKKELAEDPAPVISRHSERTSSRSRGKSRESSSAKSMPSSSSSHHKSRSRQNNRTSSDDDDRSLGGSGRSLRRESSKGRQRSKSGDNNSGRRRSSSGDFPEGSSSGRRTLRKEGSKGRLKTRGDNGTRSSRSEDSMNMKDEEDMKRASSSRHQPMNEDFDGHASFSRTLDLARSLHGDEDSYRNNEYDDIDCNASFSRTVELSRILHEADCDETRSSSKREVGERTPPSKTTSADDILLYDSQSPDKPTARKTASSTDLPKSFHINKTPRGSSRKPVFREKGSDKSREKHSPSSQSPRRVSTTARAQEKSSPTDHPCILPARSRSDSSNRSMDLDKYASPRHSKSTSRLSSGSAKITPSPATRPSSARSHTGSSSSRRDSRSSSSKQNDGTLTCPPTSPPLTKSSVSPPGLSAFERLSELEKIRSFLSDEEYEGKRREILSSV